MTEDDDVTIMIMITYTVVSCSINDDDIEPPYYLTSFKMIAMKNEPFMTTGVTSVVGSDCNQFL